MTAWRLARATDLVRVDEIGDAAHEGLPERPEVFEEKFRLCPEGWVVLEADDGTVQGYGIAHPWLRGEVPPLDTLLGRLPDSPDCIFLHDCVVNPAFRGAGRMAGFFAEASRLARRMGIDTLAGVSVYGTYRMLDRYGFRVDLSGTMARKVEGYGPTAKYVLAPLYEPATAG